MLKPKKSWILFLAIAAALLAALFPLITAAAAPTGGVVTCGGAGQPACTVLDIFYLIARVTNFLIEIAGIYAIYRLVTIGWELAVSRGIEEKITTQKEAFKYTLFGLVVVFAAFLLVNTLVGPLFGIKNLNLAQPWAYITQ